MFDIFDQPWTLLIIAAITFRVFDAFFSETRTWLQWYPLLLVIAASYALYTLNEADVISIKATTYALTQTLLAAMVLALFCVPLVRARALRQRRWKIWFLPLSLAAAAFALDTVVTTNPEAIKATIQNVLRAVESEDPAGIDAALSDDYSDQRHNDKETLMRYCRNLLARPLIDRNRKTALTLDISPPEAGANLTVVTKLDEQGWAYQTYMLPVVVTKVRLTLKKQGDKKWLINRVEVLEINKQPLNWNDVKHIAPAGTGR